MASVITLSVIGVIIGTAVWVAIARWVSDSQLVVHRIVPIVLVLSFIPDLGLGIGGTGTAWGAVFTLMVAHLVVFAVTIPILHRRLHPAQLVSRVVV